MKLAGILGVLERLAPVRYAESWDNVGLIVGDPEAEIRRVLVTVDYSEVVAEEARGDGADLVVAYHPPMFAPVKRAPHGALWTDAVRRGIALYSPHTALDVVSGGTNDFLADVCGVAARAPLQPFTSGRAPTDPPEIGVGRVGDVTETSVEEVVARLKEALGLAHLLVAGHGRVRRIAVAAGAGGALVADALRARADLFVTGEVRHHDALAAVAQGMAIVATLHSNSERAAVRAYAARIAAAVEVPVRMSAVDVDPFRIV